MQKAGYSRIEDVVHTKLRQPIVAVQLVFVVPARDVADGKLLEAGVPARGAQRKFPHALRLVRELALARERQDKRAQPRGVSDGLCEVALRGA